MSDIIVNLEDHVDGYDKTAIQAAVDGYNRTHALVGDRALQTVSRGRSVKLPRHIVLAMFNTVLNPAMAHLAGLLATHPVDAIVLVGGFATSAVLRQVGC